MDRLVALVTPLAAAASAAAGALGVGASVPQVLGYSEWPMHNIEPRQCLGKLGMHAPQHTTPTWWHTHPSHPWCCTFYWVAKPCLF